MNAKQFDDLLCKLGACREAVRWATGKNLHEVWTSCDRSDWLLWLAGRMCGRPGWHTRQQIVLAACACAETSLKYVAADEDRPRIAIETARAWARGKASIEDVSRAHAAATYAAAATYVTYAAAATYAAACAAAARTSIARTRSAAACAAAAAAACAADTYVDAAAAAAAAAACAADTYVDATYADAKRQSTRDLALAECAALVRHELPEPQSTEDLG